MHHIDPTRPGCSVTGCPEDGPYNETVWEHPGEDKKLVADTIKLCIGHSAALVSGDLWGSEGGPPEPDARPVETIEPRILAEGEKLEEGTPPEGLVGTPVETPVVLDEGPMDGSVHEFGVAQDLAPDAVAVAESQSFEGESPVFLSQARQRLVEAAEDASAMLLRLATGAVTDEELAETRRKLDQAVGKAFVYTPGPGDEAPSTSIDEGPGFIVHVLTPGQDVYQWQLRMRWGTDSRVVYTCPSGFVSRSEAMNNGVDAVTWCMERWAEMFRQSSF